MKTKFLVALLSPIALSTSQAALVWTGGGDSISLFQEANWQDDNDATPAAGTIDPNTDVTAATGGTIQITTGTGSPANFGGNFDLGGSNLEIDGGKNLSSGSSGIRRSTAIAGSLVSGSVSGGSIVRMQFAREIAWTIDDGSTIRLNGGGNPLANGSTINVLDLDSVIRFDQETYAAFDSEHSGKVSFQGSPLVFGSDPLVAEPGDNAVAGAFNGATGVEITFVPEPSASLLGLLSVSLLLHRRRG